MTLSNNLLPEKGEAYLLNEFLLQQEATHYFNLLKNQTPWERKKIIIFGKEVMQPRLVYWYSDPGISYKYSGITLKSNPWPNYLMDLKNKIETICETKFNSVLINYYRDHLDSMGWHRDNEKELGLNPIIASFSLGQMREFQLRDYQTKKNKIKLELKNNDLLIMKGTIQNDWEHSIPKRTTPQGERINLTFRKIFQK